jgi:ketosteroid isomerase-like protein
VPEAPIEVVHRAVAAWTSGDPDGFLSCFDPQCDVLFEPNVPEPGPFHGRAELRGWAERFRSAWKATRAEIVEEAANGEHVYMVITSVVRGAGSGIETAISNAFVFTVRDGLVIRWRGFAAAEEAREAAGLSQ